MIVRIAVVAALLGLGIFFFRHPAPRPAVESSGVQADSQSTPRPRPERRDPRAQRGDELVVYVVGAVRTPGLYRLRAGDRVAKAVALAGGLRSSADPAGVNLAARPVDGDEVYVPVTGDAARPGSSARRGRRRAATPPAGSVEVNRADAAELAAVPGIGRAVAARIVELRERDGGFASLDELLDVAGMTQTKLERARPYLRGP